MSSTLQITDSIYGRILTCVGYPIITESDLKLTSDQIKDLLILPALEDYFRYFPIKNRQTYSVSSNISIDFPDSDTIGIVDARININPYSTGIRTGNPLINELNIKAGSSFNSRKWGTDNDYGYADVKIITRFRRHAALESGKAFTVKVDFTERELTGYTNTYGKLLVVWAKKSEDFDDVKFNQLQDAINLAQSYIMNYFGTIWSLDNSSLPNELDPSELLSQSSDKKQEVLEKWGAHTKPIVVRN